MLLAPFVYWAFATGASLWFNLAFLALVGLTDLLDGYFARKRGEISKLGKVLDPVADKMVIAAIMLGLWRRGAFPPFIVGAYLVKEALQLTGGAVLLARERRVIPSNIWGKSSSTVFFAGFLLQMVWRDGGRVLVLIGLALSVVALITYFRASLVKVTTRS